MSCEKGCFIHPFSEGVSQAPQHFRSSKVQVICDGCFAQQFICSVISFDSDISKTIHPQEFLKVDVQHSQVTVWASQPIFLNSHSKLTESV